MLSNLFPALAVEGYIETSEATREYNCIAWAAKDNSRWWWPDAFSQYYWPAGINRVESRNSFIQVFQSLGYQVCADGDYQQGLEKIAIYEKDGVPTHAARQLPDGSWTSKLGEFIDISHTLDGLVSSVYGDVVCYLSKPI